MPLTSHSPYKGISLEIISLPSTVLKLHKLREIKKKTEFCSDFIAVIKTTWILTPFECKI